MLHPAIYVLMMTVIPLFVGATGSVLLFQVLPRQATKNKLIFKCGSCMLRVAVSFFMVDKTMFIIDYDEGGFSFFSLNVLTMNWQKFFLITWSPSP
jgi:hypothetical protein